MELKDTVELMNSADFKERFKAEYYQLKIRIEKLNAMLLEYKAGTLAFKPKCSIHVLRLQAYYMRRYLEMLECRAKVEGIEL